MDKEVYEKIAQRRQEAYDKNISGKVEFVLEELGSEKRGQLRNTRTYKQGDMCLEARYLVNRKGNSCMDYLLTVTYEGEVVFKRTVGGDRGWGNFANVYRPNDDWELKFENLVIDAQEAKTAREEEEKERKIQEEKNLEARLKDQYGL